MCSFEYDMDKLRTEFEAERVRQSEQPAPGPAPDELSSILARLDRLEREAGLGLIQASAEASTSKEMLVDTDPATELVSSLLSLGSEARRPWRTLDGLNARPGKLRPDPKEKIERGLLSTDETEKLFEM